MLETDLRGQATFQVLITFSPNARTGTGAKLPTVDCGSRDLLGLCGFNEFLFNPKEMGSGMSIGLSPTTSTGLNKELEVGHEY